jgi:1-pyrroline-4-hydroxy-2-carboxylate deaminase
LLPTGRLREEKTMKWNGVMPAITTCFDRELQIDFEFMIRHCQWLVENGCTGIVALGSLGEGGSLTFSEKQSVLKTCVESVAGKVPVISAISALTTSEAVVLAKAAKTAGCSGLMVLPPYVYKGDWPEMKAHVAAVLRATPLSAMLYNNPVAYGTDFLPHQVAELASEFENLHAIKESSTDVRRVAAIREHIGKRLQIFIGVDDAIVEGVAMGAEGWVAGLVNAFPQESVDLFRWALEGQKEKSFDLYRWFLPLLRMDTVPKFVQLIKLVQEDVGVGNARVRPPRLSLSRTERDEARTVIRQALSRRPSNTASTRWES